ncbi:ABC transporter [Halorubrum sp. AJ67]|nr:ABC transporter [Halorubrum sp. AJ67]
MNCASDAKTDVIAALEDAGVAVADFHTREASLEDLFLAYTEGDAAERDTDASDSTRPDDETAAEEVDS